ncbi:MAG: PIN domain-containing protein, partial [Leptolyngbyaceae bacterium]|nr:PIN domain-containing protein [Leptolyngbyaceae bacterium]
MKHDTPINQPSGKAFMRVLIDADVLLGFVMNRGSHIAALRTILDYASQGQVELYVTSYAIAQLNFLLKVNASLTAIATPLCETFTGRRIIPITCTMLNRARESAMKNLDAALTVEAARRAKVDAIICWDVQDFSQAHVPIWSVPELLIRLNLEETIDLDNGYEDLSELFDDELPPHQEDFTTELKHQDSWVAQRLAKLKELRNAIRRLQVPQASAESDVDEVVKGVMHKIERAHMRVNAIVAGGIILLLMSAFGAVAGMGGFRSVESVAEKKAEQETDSAEPTLDLEQTPASESEPERGAVGLETDIVAKTKDDLLAKDASLEKSALGEVVLAEPAAFEAEDSKDLPSDLNPSSEPEVDTEVNAADEEN